MSTAPLGSRPGPATGHREAAADGREWVVDAGQVWAMGAGLVLLVVGALVGGATWWLPAQAASWIAYFLVWSLLLAAPRSVVELQRLRRRGAARQSDADQLAHLTALPAMAWIGMFWLVSVAALVSGGILLLR